MSENYKADVIVVGAGPSGISAALEIAKNNKKVVLIERSHYPGSKNMYGGAVYTTALKEIFKDDFDNIPYERIINSHTWSFLTKDSSFDLTYKNSSSKTAYAVKRYDLENWMIDYIKKKGVYFCPDTLVKELIIEKDCVKGIKTELEDFYAPIVILCDGVNSLLSLQAGLRKKFTPKDMILSAKIVLKLDKKTIEERFNLKEDLSNGVNKQYFGAELEGLENYKNLFMMNYLYTFKDTIALGVGASLKDLKDNKLNVNDIINAFKMHPDIQPLIKDGETIEYSAHLIPETCYKKLPKLYGNGVLVAGDAAGFINSVHFEGTNFALMSGKYAGAAALFALENKDFSKKTLSVYQKYLKESFILKDLYSYRNIIDNLYSRSNSLSYYYPKKIKEFFEIITRADCVSKSKQFKRFICNFIKERNILELVKDCLAFVKCGIDILFGK